MYIAVSQNFSIFWLTNVLSDIIIKGDRNFAVAEKLVTVCEVKDRWFNSTRQEQVDACSWLQTRATTGVLNCFNVGAGSNPVRKILIKDKNMNMMKIQFDDFPPCGTLIMRVSLGVGLVW